MNTQITSPHLLLITQLLFSLLIKSSHGHGCHEHERRALLDFKSSLSDPAHRLSSWKVGSQHRNCCNWHGIGCSRDTFHVVSIDLRNKELEKLIKSYDFSTNFSPPSTSLTGEFSSSLFRITHLEYLDLAWNDFQESQIPLELSHLTKLTHLDLSSSSLSASIPTQFTNLTSLRYLDLSCTGDYSPWCLQSSSTEWMRGLINLEVLSLTGVDLSKATSSPKHFADDLSYLSKLEYLDISYCSISTSIFPIHGFQNLSRLSTLRLSANYLRSEIPVEMANLTSLSILDMSGCGLQGLVPYLPQLKELDVSRNGDLRPDLTRMFQHQWPKLQTLSISATNESGSIPVSISNAPLLVSLDASFCSIQGSLPSSISNLTRLQSLDLSENNITGQLQGSLPSSICNLSQLQSLDLSDNDITGSIPISICKLSSLRELDLRDNNISGVIPSCLTKLHNLTVFDVSYNSIEGNVSLINFINGLNLTTLDLSSNRLTVVVDPRFHLYSKFILESLILPSCNLKGLFPTFICKCSNLQDLDLSQNHLEGSIPSDCFSQLQIYGSFNLSNNKLHGPLPLPPHDISRYSFGNTQTTSDCYFDLSNNKFSGEISTEIGKRLSSFPDIYLAQNELSGPIPFSICLKDSTSNPGVIDLSNNTLSGNIPTSIGYCTYLLSLNLGFNNLTGNVPDELQQLLLVYLQLNDNNLDGAPLNSISKLQGLKVLNLANNHFGGGIPAALGSVLYLSILSLRSNKFNGSIPPEIFHLEQLQILDLSHNNLSGHIPRIYGKYWRGLVSIDSDSSGDRFRIRIGDDIRLQMVIKGIMIQFEKLYSYSSGIDLSCNMLDGNIPVEIGLLKELATLNLSHNHFSGDIPGSVGNMSSLGSLDVSFNRLSGHIPQSLTSLDFLGVLNLSYNELSGRIPRGTHFDTLSVDGWAFVGNDLLCGEPTERHCDGDQVTSTSDTIQTDKAEEDDKEDEKERILFYGVIALGFVVGFWGLFFVLLLKKEKLWFPYWRFVHCVAVRIIDCTRRY